MTIGESIHSILTADTAVAAIVATRVYPLVIPQRSSLPAVTYQRVYGAPVNDLAGAGEKVHARVQVDCWATSYSTVRSLADAVNSALGGAGFLPINDMDDFDDEVPVFRVVLEFTTWT